MRLLILITGFTAILAFSVYGQVPNGDFTLWGTDSLGRNSPQIWETDNDLYAKETIIQDTDRQGGSGYSAKFISDYDSISGYYLGGHCFQTDQQFTAGSQPSMISGYYKLFDPTNMGGFAVDIEVYNAAHSLIGSGNWGTPFTGSIPTWTSFSAAISYTSSDPVAYYDLDILFYNLSTDSTINGNIDDLAFDLSSGVTDKRIQQASLLKNNQGNYSIQFSESIQGPVGIEIIDSKGSVSKSIIKSDYNASEVINLDLSDLQPGIYFCVVSTNNFGKVLKLIKE
jgi:hypothetical protein